jgi:signal recognition particle subunit SRP19
MTPSLKLDGKILVWPANLDSSKTRLEGRKIPKGQSVQAPRLDELVEAARRLSLQAETTPKKSRPRNWWEKTGYITVPKKGARTELLRSLAGEVRTIRASKDLSKK